MPALQWPITAGAGGMLLTDDQQVAERARYLTTQAKDSALEYIHHEVGFKYRMSNVLAQGELQFCECSRCWALALLTLA